ncbi:hypothetical protein M9H77_17227 [Catharanthus roseus]|uniref:Uncharacterized protein n=1 Tax=Catharanthus roseus TaxID=4058 RepID=A0ACC0B411_CATRO|nr:hypothetical protein M9H77_17227 [Catharanthus roseus]
MVPKKSVASSLKSKWARVAGTLPDPEILPYPEHLSQVACEWITERASFKTIVEKSFDESVIEYFNLENIFRGLGWVPLQHIYGNYYPELVREFYANMTNKTNKDLQTIISTVKRVRIVHDREHPAAGNGPSLNHPRGQLLESSSSCSCLFLWAHTRLNGGGLSEVRIIDIYLDEKNQVWIPPSEEDRIRDRNPVGFCSVKKTTQTGMGPSSSKLIEDNDKADESYNPSDNEEDEANAKNSLDGCITTRGADCL